MAWQMENVEWKDVQGLVRSGFLDLPRAAYILWRFLPGSGPQAKSWIGNLANRLMRAEHDDPEEVHVGGELGRRLRPRSVAGLKQLIKKEKVNGRDTQAIEVGAVNVALTASGLEAL